MLGQRGAQGVIEIGHALIVFGRDRHRLAQTERISFQPAPLASRAFALVGDDHRRLAGAAGELGEDAVDRHQAHPRVDHEEDDVGRRDGGFGLRAHAAGQAIRRGLFEAGGIDHREFEIAEPAFALAAVAGNARPVIDQRQPPPKQPVEQGRLADIGPANNGDGETHGTPVLPERPGNPS